MSAAARKEITRKSISPASGVEALLDHLVNEDLSRSLVNGFRSKLTACFNPQQSDEILERILNMVQCVAVRHPQQAMNEIFRMYADSTEGYLRPRIDSDAKWGNVLKLMGAMERLILPQSFGETGISVSLTAQA